MEDKTGNENIRTIGYEDEDFQEEYGEELEDDIDGPNSEDLVGYSEPAPIGGIYGLFDNVLNRHSSIKVSNVDPKTELGETGITVREAMKIGVLAETFKHPIFAQFFYQLAGITTDSAMSKNGWFTELFVTSKKYSQKASQASINNLPQNNNKKWKMFNKNKSIPEQI